MLVGPRPARVRHCAWACTDTRRCTANMACSSHLNYSPLHVIYRLQTARARTHRRAHAKHACAEQLAQQAPAACDTTLNALLNQLCTHLHVLHTHTHLHALLRQLRRRHLLTVCVVLLKDLHGRLLKLQISKDRGLLDINGKRVVQIGTPA